MRQKRHVVRTRNKWQMDKITHTRIQTHKAEFEKCCEDTFTLPHADRESNNQSDHRSSSTGISTRNNNSSISFITLMEHMVSLGLSPSAQVETAVQINSICVFVSRRIAS